MSVAQTVTGQLNFTANFIQTSGGINPSPVNQIVNDIIQYVNATGVNFGVDQLYAEPFSLASTTATFHFQTASLKDIFGNTLAMLRIRELIIVNTNTTLSQDLEYYSSASDGITWLPGSGSPLYCRAGSMIRISDKLSFGGGVGNVISSTTDGLTLNSVSNTIAGYLMVLGCATA